MLPEVKIGDFGLSKMADQSPGFQVLVLKNNQLGLLGPGGGNSNYCLGSFTPQIGEDSQFDEHIFQRG